MTINIEPPVLDIDLRTDAGKYFFTSDWHLNHENIFYFTDRASVIDRSIQFAKSDAAASFGDVLRSGGDAYKCVGESPDGDGRLLMTCGDAKGDEPDAGALYDVGDDPKVRRRCSIIAYNHAVIDRMNSVLGDDSVLVNCGDVMLSHISELPHYMSLVRCARHIIVLGNHDMSNVMKKPGIQYSYDPLAKTTFTNTLMLRMSDGRHFRHLATISHRPMTNFTGDFNIHGHLHSTPDLGDYVRAEEYELAVACRADGKHHDCGVDRNGYMPVALSDILARRTDITSF